MSSAPDILLKACYYPAFTDKAAEALYKAQAEWHLVPLKDKISIEFPQSSERASLAVKAADIVFFWQKEAFWAAPAKLRRKGLVVDEYAQQAVGDRLDAFVAGYMEFDPAAHQQSFLGAVKRAKSPRTLLIGSGPSLEALANSSLKNTVNIYLSTAILNTSICELYPPDIIIAVDGPSQFGRSDTARRYRDCASAHLRQSNTVMLVPAQHLPVIRAHWPADIQDRIYGVPLSQSVEAGHNFAADWHYEPTSNALTSFGLPCAASLSDEIIVAGITLSPNAAVLNTATQHWAHADEAQYQRHIAQMLALHPASGQEDTSYVARHHNRLQNALTAYDSQGVTFRDVGGEDISINRHNTPDSLPKTSAKKQALFNVIAKVENYPGYILTAAFCMAGLLGAALQYSIGLPMLGFIIAGGLAVLFVAAVLFLRLRQNRMSAQLERKLSQQQAQQFANLSERLDALERHK